MKKLEITYQNASQNFQPVILFCLNKGCNYKKQSFQKCQNIFHKNHSKDCFDLQGIQAILQNDCATLKFKSDSNSFLNNKVQGLIALLTQNIDDLQNILIRSDALNNIVNIATFCFNHSNYEELFSISLFNYYQINLQQVEQCQFYLYKRTIYDLKKYAEAIQFYQLGIKLGALHGDEIVKLCCIKFYDRDFIIYNKCLKLKIYLAKRFKEAHKFFFQKSNLLHQIAYKFYDRSTKIIIQYQAINLIIKICFNPNDQDITFYEIKMLMNLKYYNESLQRFESILQSNPNYFQGIAERYFRKIDIVELLLRSQQYGLVKEYIDSQKNKLMPDELQEIKGNFKLMNVLIFECTFLNAYNI